MKKLIINILLLILVVLSGISQSSAQKTVPNSAERNFEQQSIEKYRNNKNFQYNQTIQEEPITFWDRLKMWFWKQFLKLFSNQGAAPYIRLLIVVVLLVGVAFLMLKTRFKLAWFSNKTKKSDVLLDGDIENIQTNKIETDIELEIANKNFRKAIRLMFILILKLLNDNKIIKWQREKTNYHYQNEIAPQDYKLQFKQLSYIFEYVWYGHFEPNEQHFSQYQNIYQQLKNRLDAKN